MLVGVYTCQNATLLEITCLGSYVYIQLVFWQLRSRSEFGLFSIDTISASVQHKVQVGKCVQQRLKPICAV